MSDLPLQRTLLKAQITAQTPRISLASPSNALTIFLDASHVGGENAESSTWARIAERVWRYRWFAAAVRDIASCSALRYDGILTTSNKHNQTPWSCDVSWLSLPHRSGVHRAAFITFGVRGQGQSGGSKHPQHSNFISAQWWI